MSSLAQLKKELAGALRAAGIESLESQREAELIFEHVTGLTPAQQVLKANDPIDDEQWRVIRSILRRRAQRVPLQYCLGSADFMGLKLAVCPGVFIPRTDTESLVEVALELTAGLPAPHLAEIGCGSGAITIALLKRLADARLTAIDISPAAVAATRQNALAHKVFERMTLVHGPWISCLPDNLDAIVSNPPYIPRSQAGSLDREVGEHEPPEALFGEDDDGLGFYRKLSTIAPGHLKGGGFVVLEVGDGQAEQVRSIFRDKGWQRISTHADVNGLLRVVSAVAPDSSFSKSKKLLE